MPAVNVIVRNKIATGDGSRIVCGNSDYQVVFSFDEEWAAYPMKTARFIYPVGAGDHIDVVFEGDTCPVPVLQNTIGVKVGVFAGDLRTTTSAWFDCNKSILCEGGGHPAPPLPDVYEQMVSLFQSGLGEGLENANRAETAYTAAKGSAEEAKAAASGVAEDAKAAKQAKESAESALSGAESAEKNAKQSAANAGQSEQNAKASETAAAASAVEAKEAAKRAGGVQTVNGQAPDENGNVEVEVGGVKTVNGLAPDSNGNVEVGGASSWNELKDKPFDAKIGLGVVANIVENVTESGYASYAHPIVLYDGEQYIVNYNGADYTCVAQMMEEDGSTGFILGNFGAIMGEEGTGEPFVILASADATQVYPLDGASSVSITITGMTEVVEELDKKYIKTTLDATIKEVVARIVSSNKLITIDFGEVLDMNVHNINIGKESFDDLYLSATSGKHCKARIQISGVSYTVGFIPFVISESNGFLVCGKMQFFRSNFVNLSGVAVMMLAFIVNAYGVVTFRVYTV